MDDDDETVDSEIRKQQLREKTLSRQVLPWYLGSTRLPPETVPLLDPPPGAGGIPYEPLPELDIQIRNRRRETERFKSTPYEPPEEDNELALLERSDSPVVRPPLLVCKDLDEYLVHGVTPIAFPDACVLIDIIRNYPELGFLYLKRCCSDHHINYNPYHFSVSNYFDVDPKHYFTISQFGFAEFSNSGSDFVPLNQFERDYEIYLKLLKIKVFANYYVSKFFKKWRSKMRKQKWLNLRRTMSEILVFRLHPHMINEERDFPKQELKMSDRYD